MFKSFMLLVLVAMLISACSIYYQPHGKRGGGVVIKAPEEPVVKPMPAPSRKQDKKDNNETKSLP
jgi:hypothetical protein